MKYYEMHYDVYKCLRKKGAVTWDGKEASDLYGIGKYGSDSYKIFYKNEIPEDVKDKESKRYVEQL